MPGDEPTDNRRPRRPAGPGPDPGPSFSVARGPLAGAAVRRHCGQWQAPIMIPGIPCTPNGGGPTLRSLARAGRQRCQAGPGPPADPASGRRGRAGHRACHWQCQPQPGRMAPTRSRQRARKPPTAAHGHSRWYRDATVVDSKREARPANVDPPRSFNPAHNSTCAQRFKASNCDSDTQARHRRRYIGGPVLPHVLLLPCCCSGCCCMTTFSAFSAVSLSKPIRSISSIAEPSPSPPVPPPR
jgi:hypothetical protein